MSKIISQDTYNEVVRENIEEFSMSQEEAIEDAVQQFTAQGVDLSNIIKDLKMSERSNELITKTLSTIQELLKNKTDHKTELIAQLNVIKTECDLGLPQKVAVGNLKAYDTILEVMAVFDQEEEITSAALNCMISLMTGQPDLLTTAGVDLMIKYFNTQKNNEVLVLVLRWTKECCVKHENNRQQIFNTDILNHLKPLLQNANSQILKGVCSVLRSLVLDDDVRVEFGRAHEHARTIASDTLCPIIDLLEKFKSDESVVSELLITLSALIVRNEYCKKVEDAGGLNFVLEVLKEYQGSEKLNRQALKLIKVLAGNDECKALIIQKGGPEIIAAAILAHKASSQNVVFGLNAVAALSLRSPENSKALFDAGFPEIILEVMRLHHEQMNVQKTGSWAIRNMVSRSREQCPKFISLGAEEILQEAIRKFKTDCEYDLKAALRDLGCKVEFKEEWTGKGGKITTQGKKFAEK